VAAHLNLGEFYISQGRLEAGRAEFEKAAALDPKSIEARTDLANYYSSQNSPDEAEAQYRTAVQANPDSAAARRALADFYSGRHRWEDAERTFKDYVGLEHNSPEARMTLVKFYQDSGRIGQARALLQQLLQESPGFQPAQLQLGQMALEENKYDEADRIATGILKDRPKEPEALLLLAQADVGRNQPVKAIPLLESAQRMEPGLPVIHYWKGVAYRQQGDLDLAQHSFEQAVGLDDRFSDALVALAEVSLERGLVEVALQYAQHSLALEPGRPDALLAAGHAQADLEQFGRAEATFEQYVRARPDSAEGALRLGAVYMMERKNDAAERQFERSLALDPKQTQALSDLVTLDRERGRDQQAIARVRRQIDGGETAELDDLLALTYFQMHQFQDAEQALNRSLQIDSSNFNTYMMLGALYEAENSLDRAVSQLQRAATLNAKNAALWTTLGSLQEREGKIADAERSYQNALKADANAAVAANNLAWLYCQNGGDLDKALELANRARQAAPRQANVSDTLAWIMYKRKLFAAAIPLLREAVGRDPNRASFRVHLAASLLAAGQKDSARTELETALRLDGRLRQSEDVRRILASL